MKSVVVVSGGMDSVTLLHHAVKSLKRDVLALSFEYGQRHGREVECAKFHARELNVPHRIVSLDFLRQFQSSALTNSEISVPTIEDVLGHPQPVTYVPNRNLIMLSIAAGIAEDVKATRVLYGIQKHDVYSYWDTTSDFLEAVNSVLELSRGEYVVTVEAPFVDKSKTEIIHLGLCLGVDYSQTFSCYNGREKSCGTCPTCAERRKGFRDNGIRDPLEYEVV